MTADAPAQDPPAGSLRLGSTLWRWEARPDPPDKDEDPPSPFLDWWEIRFRVDDDPEQRTRVRAGVPDEGFSDELLATILRSARERTWRDADGALWRVRLEGWPGRGISTEVADPEEGEGPMVVFVPPDGGDEIRRRAPGLDSLTAGADARLQRLLEGDDEEG